MQAAQLGFLVTHDLGKASGGDFNLESDLHHLEVHFGGSPDFFPDATTKVGNLIANAGMMRAGTRAVGTFQVDTAIPGFVRLVAVDLDGNRSAAGPATPCTPRLLKDEYIDSLTVSKVTAGTISATWVNSGRITTAESGERAELDSDGLKVFDENGSKRIEVGKNEYNGLNGIYGYEPGVASPITEMGQTSELKDGFQVNDASFNTIIQLGKTHENLYGLNVMGSDRVVRVQAGQLKDGDYGLAAVNPAGQLTKLSQLAFGPTGDDVPTPESTGSTSYVNLTTIGPSVTVDIGDTGRCIVCVGALISITALSGFAIRTASGFMSFDVSGPTPSGPIDARAAALSFRYNISGTTENTTYDLDSGVSRMTILKGLQPGEYTFTAKYRTDNSAGTSTFYDRTLIVFPF